MPCRGSGQLSYNPPQLLIRCKVNAGSLAVFRRRQPQLHRALINEQRLREKVATVQISAVDRKEINLSPAVPGTDVSGRGAAVRLGADRDDRAGTIETAPLALD